MSLKFLDTAHRLIRRVAQRFGKAEPRITPKLPRIFAERALARGNGSRRSSTVCNLLFFNKNETNPAKSPASVVSAEGVRIPRFSGRFSTKSAAKQILIRRTAALSAAAALFFVTPSAHAQTHLVIVSGLGGEKKYTESFANLSQSLADAASKRWRLPDNEILWFGEDSISKRPHFAGQSTKVNVERALNALATRAGAGDQVIIVLIGHGSGEGEDTKISIPGPDLSAHDFSLLLGKFAKQRVAFVNLTSASGDMLPILAGPNRVIITATKSAFERNESHFGQYFVDAFTKDVADTDKDGRVSMLEAFRYATAETKRLYETDSKLQSEHAQLEDMGTKNGTDSPDGKTGEGLLARRFFLDAPGGAKGMSDARLAALYKEKFGVEDQIDQLRLKKTSMAADAYDDALEPLFVQLARKAKEIRDIEGRNP